MQAEATADLFFVRGLKVAEGADCSGEFADAHVFRSGIEALEVALHLAPPEEELEAEGGGFGVDAMGAADARSVLELDGASLEDVGQSDDAFADDA